jgi:transient receptor potential cation channel subfamily A protein 1
MGLFQPWQWQLGAACVFIAWTDLLLFFRRLPTLGIYVVMIVEIVKTFLRFSVIFFVFSLGFALTFNVLLRNQVFWISLV